MQSAVFLDRDGVLNVYLPGDYVKSVAELTLLPQVGEAVARLNAAGLPVFIISNQQGVAKGVMTQADLDQIDSALHKQLGAGGGKVNRSYYCTDSAKADSPDRKPRPGMILRAAKEHDIDLAASFFVGDTETDAEAGRSAGVGHFILVLTGKHTDAAAAVNPDYFPIPPDYVAADLTDAVQYILSKR